ncbi:recombinase family protein [Rhodopseudomonas sp.]|uniref:recombinase family protein n=1 Tax=Rhodopseudomonas sp. TaxID=1078 RepID=UPI0039E254BF
MAIIGYARVSTVEQDYDGQIERLTAAGATQIFCEKESGAKSDRRELAKAVSAIGPGDVLLITRLDRLARSTLDLLNLLDTIGRRGAGFRSLADAWADTTTAHGRLLLTILAGLAEFERELIRARTADGRERARRRGVRMGRRPKLTPFQIAEALARRAAGEPVREIARSFAVAHSTIARLKP